MAPRQPPKGERNVASSKVKFQTALMLGQVCQPSDGSAVYGDGWSDQRVADEVAKLTGEQVSVHTVARMRQENIGPLRAPKPVDPTEAIGALEKRVSALEEKIDEALDRISSHLDALEGAVLGPNGDLFTAKTGGAHVNGRV